MSRTVHAALRGPRLLEDKTRRRRIRRGVERARARVAPREPQRSFPPIVQRDAGRFGRFPASVRDVEDFLPRLPDHALLGIASIELALDAGKATTIVRGVACTRTLGAYDPGRQRVRVHGFVYEDALPHRRVVEAYLRLRMLMTLVHEIAHHVDRRARDARGRWSPDLVTAKATEAYAEDLQRAWTEAYVIPFLREERAQDVEALGAFLEEHGGARVDLETLARFPGFPIGGSAMFEALYDDVVGARPRRDVRLGFAGNIEMLDGFDEAARVLLDLLANDATDAEARALLAHVRWHQRRWDEAIALAREALGTTERVSAAATLLRIAIVRGDAELVREVVAIDPSAPARVSEAGWPAWMVELRTVVALADGEACKDALLALIPVAKRDELRERAKSEWADVIARRAE